jgi:methyl-accepting chemotaxis protein
MGLNKILNSSQFQFVKPESINMVYDASVGGLDDLLATRVGRFNQRRALSLGAVSISIVIAALFIISIRRSISRPIAELKEMTDCISKGDLSTSADIDRRDEISQVAGAIKRLQKALRGDSKVKAAA